MSILGVVARMRPHHLCAVVPRLAAMPGLDVALNPGDGRLVLVIEDALHEGSSQAAAGTLDALANWPEMMSVTLVYEYSGPDAPAPAAPQAMDYRAWRGSLQNQAAAAPPL